MKRKGLCLIMVLCMLAGCAQAGGENGGAAAETPAEEEQAGSGLQEEQSAEEDLSRTVSLKIICPGKRRHPHPMENIPLW